MHHAGLMAEKQGKCEAVAHDHKEDGHHHIGNGRGKQRRLFLKQQNREAPHAAALAGCRVSSRNTRSRSGWCSVSSETAIPAPTSAATISAATDGRRSAWIKKRTAPAPPTGSTANPRTPAIVATMARTASSPEAGDKRRHHAPPP